jgi:hypothetical protein
MERRYIFNLKIRDACVIFGILGFFIGFLGAYYIQDHYYYYFAYSTLCWAGFHWHHLYSGGIITVTFSIILLIRKPKELNLLLLLWFLICLGLGIMVDDLVNHFLFRFDPFIFYC